MDNSNEIITNRNLEIDVIKGLLTLCMIFSHAIGMLYDGQNILLLRINSYILVIVAFSGFLFCFGFAAWMAYYQKTNIPWDKVIKTSLKCYFAFVISGVAWALIVESKPLELEVFSNVILIRALPVFAEFLLTFAIVIFVGAVFRNFITIATQNWKKLLIVTAFCLAFTFLPTFETLDPFISTLIGGGNHHSFPLIQYFPLFLLGIFTARHNITWFTIKVCLFGTLLGSGLLWVVITFETLQEFPPSASWIISAIGLLCAVCLIAKLIVQHFPKIVVQYLNMVGQNVLAYLLLSNLFIMFSYAINRKNPLNDIQVFLFVAAVLVIIFFIQWVSVDLKRANQNIKETSYYL